MSSSQTSDPSTNTGYPGYFCTKQGNTGAQGGHTIGEGEGGSLTKDELEIHFNFSLVVMGGGDHKENFVTPCLILQANKGTTLSIFYILYYVVILIIIIMKTF